MNSKICKECGKELPLSEFHKCKGMADGHHNICKTCRNQKNKQWRAENVETRKEYFKQYYVDNAEARKQYFKQWLADNAEYLKKYFKKYGQRYGKEYQQQYHKEWAATKLGRATTLANAYKQTDKKHNRDNNIDAQWIIDNIFTSSCVYCGETDWRKLGCDRIDNSKGHIVDNVVCSCWKCNRERHTKPFDEFYANKKVLS